MARIIAIANQKGGVGKTTTAVNLSASLAAAEQRVLAIDLDPQGNLSSGLGFPATEVEHQVYDVLLNQQSLRDAVCATDLPTLRCVPATTDLIGAEIELVDAPDRHIRLKRAVESEAAQYDYIIIDCPPSLGLLTLNALVCARHVLIPMQAEYYALEGLGHLMATIERIRESLNPSIELEGIVFCMFDKRTNLSRQVADEVREHFKTSVFETVIPRNVRLGEAPSFGKPALLYDVDSVGAQSYLALAEEMLQRHRERDNSGYLPPPPLSSVPTTPTSTVETSIEL